MEALSAAASGIAVVSLSIQLVQSIGTIKAFIRGVRGASTELERLVELLDRLNALLEDVRNIMEQQTALQDQHFPTPSMTIFNCLKSCETSLQSLHKVVEKYTVAHGSNASALMRLKEDIKFGFKTKDIADFEARIQRDIEYLHAALGMNTTSILTTVLPVLLRNQYNTSITYSHPRHQYGSVQNPAGPSTSHGVSTSSQKATTTISIRQSWISSSLEMFNIYQRKSVRYVSLAGQGQYKDATKETISECYEIFLHWRLFSRGIHWTQKYHFGSIVPGLSTYPVVDDFDRDHVKMIQRAPVQEIHQFLSSGRLHPFTRDVDGWSLLHWAAYYTRTDVCQLLLGYGLKPDLTHEGTPQSPLVCCLLDVGAYSMTCMKSDLLDTIRVFLLESDQIDDYTMFSACFGYATPLDLAQIEWIWYNAATVFFGDELIHIRKAVAQELVGYYRVIRVVEPITQLLVKLLDDEMLNHYLSETWILLPHLFDMDGDNGSFDSDRVGGAYLDLLQRFGLDVETCVSSELEQIPEGVMETWHGNRKIIFEPHAIREWTLRWEWVYDPSESGYLVASEYNAFSGDAYELYPIAWPFRHWDNGRSWEDFYREGAKWEARFSRRVANNARKERARTGQKRQRSKMPGTWAW